jgi:hypothetical protein
MAWVSEGTGRYPGYQIEGNGTEIASSDNRQRPRHPPQIPGTKTMVNVGSSENTMS